MIREERLIILIFLLSLLLLNVEWVQAQNSQITVQDALQVALQNNPELNRALEEIQIQKADVGRSWGVESPELYFFKEGMDVDLFTEQRWGISQRLKFPLTGYYQSRSEKAEVEKVQFEFEAIKKSIQASVKSAYTDLAYALKFVQIKEQEVQLASELRTIAEARLEVGESTELDLIQAEIQYTGAQNELRVAEEERNRARYALFTIMGLDPDRQRYGIEYPDTLAFFDLSIDQQEVMDGIQNRPEIQAVRKQIDASEQSLKAARSGYLPAVRVDLYRQDFGAGYEFNGFEVGISIPLWFTVNESRDVSRAKAANRQSTWNVKERELSLKQSAENAWHSYENSRETILSHRDFIQSRSESLLELTREGYRMGELNLLHVLEAQRTYLNGQQLYYQTLRNYYLQLIELERFLPFEIVFTE